VETLIRIEPNLSEVRSPHGVIPVAEVRLGGVPRGAVVVLCDEGGFDRDSSEILNGLAEHGYESVAAELGVDGSTLDREPGTADAGVDARSGTDVVAEVDALLDHLRFRGWCDQQIGVVGLGAGGQIALRAASEFGLGAVVSISPQSVSEMLGAEALSWVDQDRVIRTPWLGLVATRGPDHTKRILDLESMLDERSPVYVQIVGYPGVAETFYRDSREAVEHAASFDAWQRTVEWLNLRVVPRPTPLAEAWAKKAALR